ncbi:MAG: AAA family ATPase [Actinobacteria bacterium]|nr:AAA family ATPase [Actinomycetota bacterium]
MSISVALAGKGGTGKTTLCALIIRSLIEEGKTPVLALDADPNSNLNEVLGVKITKTVGSLREEFKRDAPRYSKGMYKDQIVEMNIHQALVEGNGFDLLAMGRGEGPGCYCYANTLFRKYIDVLQENYNWVVMDNEAGMEHLSRRTTRDIDFLLIVSDFSPKGILTASRIRDLALELKLKIGRILLIVNRVNSELDVKLIESIKKTGLEILSCVNLDASISEMDLSGESIFDLPSNSIALTQVKCFVRKLVSEIGELKGDWLKKG